MKFLVDTHVLLWFYDRDSRLSKTARLLIEADDSERIISAASVWEIAIKVSAGKLTLPVSMNDYIAEKILDGFQISPIEWPHAAKVAELPYHHRDPFDRLIAAQALVEKLPLLSRDPIFKAYGVKTVW